MQNQFVSLNLQCSPSHKKWTLKFSADVHVGLCCPAPLNCIGVDVHTVVLLANKMMMMMF